jgi:hypothetical protein
VLWCAGADAGGVMALGVTRRVRLARRADRVWQSVYLRQLVMERDQKPLTTVGWSDINTERLGDLILDRPTTNGE